MIEQHEKRQGDYRVSPRYELSIRRRDHATRLVDSLTGEVMPIRCAFPINAGLVIRPKRGIGVLLMPEEIRVVETFSELEEPVSHTDSEE